MTGISARRVPQDGHASKHLVMLHGIFGRGRNWQTIARTVTGARPEYACWLVDLPYHGDSGPATQGNTIPGLAADVRAWMDAQRIVPSAILGHSYGGKVALAIAAQLPDVPLQVWVIDSTPETKDPAGSAWQMIDVIRRMPLRFDTRDAAVAALMDAGYETGVAQWMTTNLERGPEGFTWRLDFDVMEELMRDFFRTDLWHVVERPSPRHEIHFVKASESSAISDAAVQRIEAATSDRVRLHHRKGGHWIHAESPQVVSALLIDHLP